MAFTEASNKSRDVPNAADNGKNVKTTKNKMGQPEQTVTQNGDRKHVLNELDPEEGEEEIMDDFDITARRNSPDSESSMDTPTHETFSGSFELSDVQVVDKSDGTHAVSGVVDLSTQRGPEVIERFEGTIIIPPEFTVKPSYDGSEPMPRGDIRTQSGPLHEVDAEEIAVTIAIAIKGATHNPRESDQSRGFSMKRQIDETVQDQSGVTGDFMDKMGGKTDRLGASQKNTGGAYEKHSESSSGSPDDGVQTAVGKGNLVGGSQKNTGGSHEEFGDSTSTDAKDGIQDPHSDMAGDLGQNEKQKNKGGAYEQLKGSKNKMSEDWSIGGVAGIMEEGEINLQALFNSYAREANPITCEDFEVLATAHGYPAILDESTFEALMGANTELLFYESEDDAGRFWMSGPITEDDKPFPGAAPPFGSEGGGDDDDDDGGDEVECEGDEETCESTRKGRAIKERFGGAEETAYDPFAVDLDRAMTDPGYSDEQPITRPTGLGRDRSSTRPPGPGDLAGIEAELGEPGMDELGEPGMEEPGMEEPGADEFGEPGMDYYDDETMGEEDPGMQMDERPAGRDRFEDPRRRRDPMGGMGAGMGLESRNRGGTINEMTGTSGIAAPPMGASMSRGTAAKREEPIVDVDTDIEDEDDGSIKVVEGFQQCRRCGGILDKQGCPTCALMRETHELGVDAPDPSTDAGGHFTSDATKSGKGNIGGSTPNALTSKSGSTSPDDGITSELGGMGSQLGQNEKQKNKGGQHEPLEGGGSGMQENINRLARSARREIQEGALSLRKNGRFGVSMVVRCEGIRSRLRRNLTEALVDVEELIQAYGRNAVQLEAHFFNNQKVLSKRIVPLPKIARRGPVVCESRCIFRYAEVANDFADQVVREGVKCKVDRHNWGASVAGQYNWKTAKRAFGNIPILEGRSFP